jgi:hypothetical protein
MGIAYFSEMAFASVVLPEAFGPLIAILKALFCMVTSSPFLDPSGM